MAPKAALLERDVVLVALERSMAPSQSLAEKCATTLLIYCTRVLVGKWLWNSMTRLSGASTLLYYECQLHAQAETSAQKCLLLCLGPVREGTRRGQAQYSGPLILCISKEFVT
eukprot:4103910-Amphidinium_carterae.1